MPGGKYHHHLAAVAEMSPIILHQTVLFAMATERSSNFIPVSLEMVLGKVCFFPVKPSVPKEDVRCDFTFGA